MEDTIFSPFDFVDLLEFVSISQSNIRHTDYGTGELFTQIEVHTIGYLAANPGTTVTQMAINWCRTKGSISQMIKKLEAQGLIYRSKEKENSKSAKLYLTPKGEELQRYHVEFDNNYFVKVINRLKETHSQEELNTTYRVLSTLLEDRRLWFEQK